LATLNATPGASPTMNISGLGAKNFKYYDIGGTKQFVTFVRAEMLDLNAQTPTPPKAIYDGTEKQTHIIAGIGYLPIPNVVIKADVRLAHTGPQNPELVINPAPNALPYKQSNQFFNIGIGYSF
jgi:hypothetical protein